MPSGSPERLLAIQKVNATTIVEQDGEESEIALGGHNSKRLLGPLSWASVAMADEGYWQIAINAVRINGHTLDVCRDGTCRGIVLFACCVAWYIFFGG